MFYKIKADWDTEDGDINEGFLWGIEYWEKDENTDMQFVDVEWFESESERDEKFLRIDQQIKDGSNLDFANM